jgi:hypothetical protein
VSPLACAAANTCRALCPNRPDGSNRTPLTSARGPTAPATSPPHGVVAIARNFVVFGEFFDRKREPAAGPEHAAAAGEHGGQGARVNEHVRRGD